MYVVRVTNGKFQISGQVKGEDAIGPDTCTRF
jgi:branched-chain amino acid transport system substrate-binding protein